MIQILELFGGIGSPRVALRNIGIPVKSIDYVEIDPKAVNSYNAMFGDELNYIPQSVVGWNLKPDILIHGSPCQQISISGYISPAGEPKGFTEGSGTESSLMWETVHIIEQMGKWKPKTVIWENVKNVTGKHMRKNFDRYLEIMKSFGYRSSFECLDARGFGLPQARKRVFTISRLDGIVFDFSTLEHHPMRPIYEFLETNVSEEYLVTQPSILRVIGKRGIKRATIIKDYAYTITERQDRSPAQVIDCGNGRYRYLTDRECWRLQGYTDLDYERAAAVNSRRVLYRQAGNSIPVPIFESIFKQLLNNR